MIQMTIIRGIDNIEPHEAMRLGIRVASELNLTHTIISEPSLTILASDKVDITHGDMLMLDEADMHTPVVVQLDNGKYVKFIDWGLELEKVGGVI
jgi:hypothetical protein